MCADCRSLGCDDENGKKSSAAAVLLYNSWKTRCAEEDQVKESLQGQESGTDHRRLTGQCVTISGLLGSPHLNGKQGIALEWMEGKGRYQVQLNGASVLAVKPENLTCEKAVAVGSEDKESLDVRRAIALSLATASGSSLTTNEAADDASSQDSELGRAVLASARSFEEDRLRREVGARAGEIIHGKIREGLSFLIKDKKNGDCGGAVLDPKKRQRLQEDAWSKMGLISEEAWAKRALVSPPVVDLTGRQPRGNTKPTAIPPNAVFVDLSDY